MLKPVEHSVPFFEKLTLQLKKRLGSLRLSQQNFQVTLELIIQLGYIAKTEILTDWTYFFSQEKDLSDFILKVSRTRQIVTMVQNLEILTIVRQNTNKPIF